MIRSASFVLALVLLVNTAAAQSFANYDSKPDSYWETLEVQIKRSLEENVDGVASQQLRNVVVFRSLYGDRVNLADAVPAVIKIHRTSKDRETRELAVAALQSINSFEARSYVRNRVSHAEMEGARIAARDALISALERFTFAEGAR